DPADNVVIRKRLGGTLAATVSGAAYDRTRRITFSTNAVGNVTAYAYAFDGLGQFVTTTTQRTNSSSGITTIETTARDGSRMSLTGSSVHGMRYEYGVNGAGQAYSKEIKLNADGSDTAESLTNLL